MSFCSQRWCRHGRQHRPTSVLRALSSDGAERSWETGAPRRRTPEADEADPDRRKAPRPPFAVSVGRPTPVPPGPEVRRGRPAALRRFKAQPRRSPHCCGAQGEAMGGCCTRPLCCALCQYGSKVAPRAPQPGTQRGAVWRHCSHRTAVLRSAPSPRGFPAIPARPPTAGAATARQIRAVEARGHRGPHLTSRAQEKKVPRSSAGRAGLLGTPTPRVPQRPRRPPHGDTATHTAAAAAAQPAARHGRGGRSRKAQPERCGRCAGGRCAGGRAAPRLRPRLGRGSRAHTQPRGPGAERSQGRAMRSAPPPAGPSRDVASRKLPPFPTPPRESAEGEERCLSIVARRHMGGFSAVT